MLHPDAATVRLIHRHMIEEELARHRAPSHQHTREPVRPARSVRAPRRVTARLLRRLAGWLEPRPQVDGPLPPTEPAT